MWKAGPNLKSISFCLLRRLIAGRWAASRMLCPVALLSIAIPATVGWVQAAEAGLASASSTAAGFRAGGVMDGDRFSVKPASAWQGATNASSWWWQVQFQKPRPVGAILQVMGDHAFVFQNAPR